MVDIHPLIEKKTKHPTQWGELLRVVIEVSPEYLKPITRRIRITTTVTKYRCVICGAVFDTLEDAIKHYADVHGIPDINILPPTEQPQPFTQTVEKFKETVAYNFIDELNKVGRVVYVHKIIPCITGIFTRSAIEGIRKVPFVKFIWYDTVVKHALKESIPAQHVDKSWQTFKVSGDGITVAVVDTGLDSNHVALKGRVIHREDFTDNKEPELNPHGTHCAGIIGGKDDTNKIYGVAPAVKFVDVRVLDSKGGGRMSNILNGIEWIYNFHNTYGIRIVSMSLGGSDIFCNGSCPMCRAVGKLVDKGIHTVIAVGNEGWLYYTTACPGKNAKCIGVGAVDDTGKVAKFSSRGGPFWVDKPDISACGVNILSAYAGTGDKYIEMSGTSMATPHIAGIIALMLDMNPKLTPEQAKNIIMKSTQTKGVEYVTGAGWIDAYKCLENVYKGGV